MNEFDDLDFNDVVENKPKKKAKPLAKKKRKTEISLTIPTDMPRQWISKDLVDCTGEEFVMWAKTVHIMGFVDNAAEALKNPIARKEMFNLIVSTSQSLFGTKREDTTS